MQPQLETRVVTLFGTDEASELRIAPETPNRLVGYAAVFNSLSADLGGFKERIKPGAFNQSLTGGGDIRALVDHDSSKLLGRTSSGTLRIGEDERGLRVEIDLPDTSHARDVLSLVKRRDVRGMSFGFRVREGGQRFTKEAGQTIRELSAIDLREVTVTSIPAYADTSLNVRVDPAIAKQVAAENSGRPQWSDRMALLRNTLVRG